MASKEYHLEYNTSRYKRVMIKAKAYLGGVCSMCGTADKLEFDHIDPSTKEFAIAKGWARSRERLYQELDKCQLLCKSCHVKKTNQDHARVAQSGRAAAL